MISGPLTSGFLALNIVMTVVCIPLQEEKATVIGTNIGGWSDVANLRDRRSPVLDDTLAEIDSVLHETSQAELDVIYLEEPNSNGEVKTSKDEPPEEQFRSEEDGLFESDIHLVQEQAQVLKELINEQKSDEDDLMVKRKGIGNLANRWPDGVVPYTIDESISDQTGILKAIKHWEYYTCLRFVPQTPELIEEIEHSDHLEFQKGEGFWSYVGRVGLGPQTVSIGDETRVGSIAHELGHAIGFWHEQARPDRDDHVTIAVENVMDGFESAFKKYDWEEVVLHDVPYDVGSLMHYGAYYFSKNGMPTIVAKNADDQDKLGNRNTLSKHDIVLANAMYECSDVRCQDKSPNQCASWAKRGFCLTGPYVGYMIGNCPKSCDICHDCADRHKHCKAWVKSGYCTKSKYTGIVQSHCKLSCGICTLLSAPEE